MAQLTGVTVDHYAEIGLLGFALITDALAASTCTLKNAVLRTASGADFPAGWQAERPAGLPSFDAAAPRSAAGDLDRVVRQQAVMASLAHQVISEQDVGQSATLNRLRGAVQRSVVLDGWDIMRSSSTSCRSWRPAAWRSPPFRCSTRRLERRRHAERRAGGSRQVKDWVNGLLTDQAQGKTEQTPTARRDDGRRAQRFRCERLAAAVSEIVAGKGFTTGQVGNNDAEKVSSTQVQAPRSTIWAVRPSPASWAGCRWWPVRRCRRERSGWCWPPITRVRVRVRGDADSATADLASAT